MSPRKPPPARPSPTRPSAGPLAGPEDDGATDPEDAADLPGDRPAAPFGDPFGERSPRRAKVLDFPAPRRSHRVRNTVLSVLAVVLVLGGVVAYAVFSPALALRTVVVEGNTLIGTDEVEAALAPLEGISLTRISHDQVRDLLADKPPLEDVIISAEPPSTLVVTVRERVPVAVLQSGPEFVLIDADGRQLATVAQRDEVQLPLIDGGTAAVNTGVFSSITAVLAELPAPVLARLNSASASSVDSIRLSLSGDRRIFWGSAERSAEKALVLEALLALPETDPAVREFDVSTPDRPVTR